MSRGAQLACAFESVVEAIKAPMASTESFRNVRFMAVPLLGCDAGKGLAQGLPNG